MKSTSPSQRAHTPSCCCSCYTRANNEQRERKRCILGNKQSCKACMLQQPLLHAACCNVFCAALVDFDMGEASERTASMNISEMYYASFADSHECHGILVHRSLLVRAFILAVHLVCTSQVRIGLAQWEASRPLHNVHTHTDTHIHACIPTSMLACVNTSIHYIKAHHITFTHCLRCRRRPHHCRRCNRQVLCLRGSPVTAHWQRASNICWSEWPGILKRRQT